MAEPLALTTVATVKLYARMTPSQVAGVQAPVSSVDDPLIQVLVDAASVEIAKYCGRNFAVDDYTEIRNGTGTSYLMLRNYPVTEVDSLVLISPRTVPTQDSPSTTLTLGVDFTFEESGKLSMYAGCFPKGIANVEVVYKAGFTTPPGDLLHAASKWCAIRYREIERLGQKSVSHAGDNISYDLSDLPPDVMGILDRYRSRSAIPGLTINTQ